MIWLFYAEIEIFSWIVFKNECLYTYLYRKETNPTHQLGDRDDVSDFTIPLVLHNIGYLIRIVLFAMESTIRHTIAYALLFISQIAPDYPIVDQFFRSRIRYLLLPFIFYLFHSNYAPFSTKNMNKYKIIVKYGVVIFAFFLLFVLIKSNFSQELYEPLIIGYLILASLLFLAFCPYIGTRVKNGI